MTSVLKEGTLGQIPNLNSANLQPFSLKSVLKRIQLMISNVQAYSEKALRWIVGLHYFVA